MATKQTTLTGLKRDTTDKFYTKPDIVNRCLDIVKDNVNIEINDTIIEPSAGNGVFLMKLKELYPERDIIGYDIEPDHDEIEKVDFLEQEIDISNKDNKIHIIGNPPFGRQSSKAKKFIEKCCKFSDTISFILPKSFKKTSFSKVFNEYFHNIHTSDLEENAFQINEKEYNVPCIFQIWEKKSIKRESSKRDEPKHFRFVKKTDEHNISVRRVGVNTCNCDTNTENKSVQSHYFIRLNEGIDVDDFIDKFNQLSFDEKNNTVGSKSISKQELIEHTNKLEF